VSFLKKNIEDEQINHSFCHLDIPQGKVHVCISGVIDALRHTQRLIAVNPVVLKVSKLGVYHFKIATSMKTCNRKVVMDLDQTI